MKQVACRIWDYKCDSWNYIFILLYVFIYDDQSNWEVWAKFLFASWKDKTSQWWWSALQMGSFFRCWEIIVSEYVSLDSDAVLPRIPVWILIDEISDSVVMRWDNDESVIWQASPSPEC